MTTLRVFIDNLTQERGLMAEGFCALIVPAIQDGWFRAHVVEGDVILRRFVGTFEEVKEVLERALAKRGRLH